MRTQVASSVVADRLPAMCGSATFATEVSSTSINVASITETAISHGLNVGTHCCGGVPPDSSAISAYLTLTVGSADIPGHELLYFVGRLVEDDLYRNSLNDLYEISRGVFGWKYAEPRTGSGLEAFDVTVKASFG